MRPFPPLFLLSAALLAPGAIAQDSVSKTGSDAVDAFSAAEQLNTYVVDMTPITTSWGTSFGIAPIAKGSVLDPAFATGFINSQAASPTVTKEVCRGIGIPQDHSHRIPRSLSRSLCTIAVVAFAINLRDRVQGCLWRQLLVLIGSSCRRRTGIINESVVIFSVRILSSTADVCKSCIIRLILTNTTTGFGQFSKIFSIISIE